MKNRKGKTLKLKTLVLVIAFSLLLPLNSFASSKQIQLMVNELRVFPVNELHRVAVSDPSVADVTVLSDRELMLMAKQAGATNMIVWDKSGQRSFNIVVNDKDLEKVAERIRELLISSDIRQIRVKQEEENIYVIGEVLGDRDIEKIEDVLAPFANVVNLVKIKEQQPLVEVNVRVLEVAFDDMKTLGMDWSNGLPITYTEGSGSAIDGKVPKLWKTFRWDRTAINARLNFLIEEDQARTLSNPKLVTLSGKEASFLVGGEVPYVTQEETGKTEVQWKEYGINLKILPLVNSKNQIKVQIKAEVSDLDAANAVTHEGFSIPAIKTREAETELFLNDGDTIFIAGLIKNGDSENIDRLPWLSRVPVFGELFKSTQFQNERTELVISVTPSIIGEKADPDFLASEMLKQEALLEAQRHFPAYGEETSPVVYYTHMIEDIIARSVTYPEEARKAQHEGIVKIDLRLLPNGHVKDATIKESAGSAVLDQAALDAVEKASPYPSFPSSVTQPQLRLTVPVVFKNYIANE